MRIHVLALDDVFDLGLSAVLDAFRTANELADISGLSGERFEIKIVAVTKSVKTSQGLTVPLEAIGARAPDCVVVPAIGFKMPEPLEAALARPDIQDAAALLEKWARKGAMMTAACIGTFIMAESGLLDHQRATTLFRRLTNSADNPRSKASLSASTWTRMANMISTTSLMPTKSFGDCSHRPS